jgi:sugar phosphate isomerase/epimerase
LEAAATLGADSIYVRPGSLNPNGPWTPHSDNHTPETRERLIESLIALAPLAEATGVPLALEAHVVSPLNTVAVVREVLDRVASPWLRFNADPVNLIGTLDQAYRNTAVLNDLFDQVGEAVICAHAKDVTVGERLVLHIDECVPGQGLLDQETFLRRFEACCPRGAVLIEHLPAERVPEARRALLEFAARAGLRFEELD